MIRRLTAAATWVLLLHLNLITLVASDLVCARHHEMSAGAMPAAVHPRATPNTVARESGVTDGDHQPCEIPSRADCCRAMASCSVSVGLAPSKLAASPTDVRAAVITARADAPLSFAVAPEPPPPKA